MSSQVLVNFFFIRSFVQRLEQRLVCAKGEGAGLYLSHTMNPLGGAAGGRYVEFILMIHH